METWWRDCTRPRGPTKNSSLPGTIRLCVRLINRYDISTVHVAVYVEEITPSPNDETIAGQYTYQVKCTDVAYSYALYMAMKVFVASRIEYLTDQCASSNLMYGAWLWRICALSIPSFAVHGCEFVKESIVDLEHFYAQLHNCPSDHTAAITHEADRQPRQTLIRLARLGVRSNTNVRLLVMAFDRSAAIDVLVALFCSGDYNLSDKERVAIRHSAHFRDMTADRLYLLVKRANFFYPHE